ncbi:MAG: Sua5/YciO/YrdC/YwlC family protein [Gammaproteobacteria bacterium]|nr:Sua5/YciO/YrdC/YwlC family protein [Gammaproteobacteria bacterium]
MKASALEYAARVIHDGGVIAYPTESCYGLGCSPKQHNSVRRVLRLKHRPFANGVIIIGATLSQVMPYISACDPRLVERARTTWPGPYTWLLPANTSVSRWLRGQHDSVAIRVTAHRGAAALCRYAKQAIVSTSANRHGYPPARSADEVRNRFGETIDYVLEGTVGGHSRPSEIRDALSNRVIRHG